MWTVFSLTFDKNFKKIVTEFLKTCWLKFSNILGIGTKMFKKSYQNFQKNLTKLKKITKNNTFLKITNFF